MSVDGMSLESLCVRTKATKLRYVELVTLPCPPVASQPTLRAARGASAQPSHGKDASAGTTQVYFCVAEHALFLVRRSMGGLYPSEAGGEIFYANIVSIVEDENTVTDMLITLNDNRPSDWMSELYINCEHREKLCNYLQVAWQTDVAWRLDMVQTLPRSTRVLRASAPASVLRVRPFRFYQEVRHEGYAFFIKGQRDPKTSAWRGYEDLSSAMHSGAIPTYHDKQRNVTLYVQVWEEKSLAEAERRGLDHIRWVAMEQKQHIASVSSSVLVVRNAAYVKKMNLANDVAQWTGWELHLRSPTHVMITVFLRRQYLPPGMDTVQDMSVTIECPLRELKRTTNPVSEEELLIEARLAADSASPVVENCTRIQTVYRDLVQSKLDTLYFNEDAMTWLKVQLELTPKHELEASQFTKSILRILQEENALSSPDLINEVGDVKFIREPMDVLKELMKQYFYVDDMQDEEDHEQQGKGKAAEAAAHAPGGAPVQAAAVPGGNAEELVRAALGHEKPLPSGYGIWWNQRATLEGMRRGAWQASFQPDNAGKVEQIKDSQRSVPLSVQDPTELRDVSMQCIHEVYNCIRADAQRRGAMNAFLARIARYFAYCIDGALLGSKFTIQDITSPFMTTARSETKLNEIIMFLLHIRPRDMNQPWQGKSLRHLFENPLLFRDYTFNDRVLQSLVELGWINKQLRLPSEKADDSLSLKYAKFLARVLVTHVSSANLKAAVCRQIMGANQKSLHSAVLLPALLQLMEEHSTFIRTYATVTLVNMSGSNEGVKHAIMGELVARICAENLRSQDDDLLRYTLILLTHLTKNPHHRSTMAGRGPQYVGFGSVGVDLDKSLLDMLMRIPCVESKYEIIAELASVIGQLCNDQEMFRLMCKPEYHLLENIENLLDGAPTSSRTRSKLMFALKQFCGMPYAQAMQAGLDEDPKEMVGMRVIPIAVAEIKEYLDTETADAQTEMGRRRLEDRRSEDRASMTECATNAILLLFTLSTAVANCERLRKEKFDVILQGLTATKLYVNDTLASRLDQLRSRVEQKGADPENGGTSKGPHAHRALTELPED